MSDDDRAMSESYANSVMAEHSDTKHITTDVASVVLLNRLRNCNRS